MSEIRPIRDAEADDFLQLLCQVFGLDQGRAADIFYREPFYDLNRKWALFEGREMVSVLTTVPIQFGWGRGIGIAGVATRKLRQGEGLATRLLQRVLKHAEDAGEGPALLFARETKLYERAGFEPIDRIIRAPLTLPLVTPTGPPHPNDHVRAVYDHWAAQDPNRLRRDAQRWSYWEFSYKVCETVGGDGYVVSEPLGLREGLFHRSVESLPLPAGTEWYGTTAMADLLGLTFESARVELYLMGRNWPGVPLMFMTDQF